MSDTYLDDLNRRTMTIEDAIHAGILEAVKAHPEFKIVTAVPGDWG